MIFFGGGYIMPRRARRKSKTGVYHIMLRGVNKQVIFEDSEDYERFRETVNNYKSICGYCVFAYCLMSNHVHMLLKDESGDIGAIIKRLAGSYVYWYNRKYQRVGHLFQERFKSEPIEDDSYLLSVLRYIHRNPVNVGLDIESKYSSYNEYTKQEKGITDTEFIFGLMSVEQYTDLHKKETSDKIIDFDDKATSINDTNAKEIISIVSRCKSAAEFQALEQGLQSKYINKLRERGLSIRQISRLTGTSKGITEKMLRQ